jgi:hypothetical protein
MALRFSPLDVDATIWFTADGSRIETFPDTDRVRKWFDRGPTRDYPLTGFSHGIDPAFPLATAPRFAGDQKNGLAGRSTLAFPAGSYLKGATQAWTGGWNTPEPNTPWSYYPPFGGVPEEQTYWWESQPETYRYIDKAIPVASNHGFLLARVFPPGVPTTDAVWTSTPTGYQDANGYLPRRAPIWSPRVGSGVASYPGLLIEDWVAGALKGSGSLRFYGDALAASEGWRLDYASPLPQFKVVDYDVPFDRFGEWTLFEWRTAEELVDGTSYRFCSLYLNGRLASKVICPTPLYSSAYGAFDLHLFGESLGETSFADLRASKASGNIAEMVICGRALSADEAARMRAWLCRRWGLERLLVGQPYASLPEIPGSEVDIPWAFPGIRPSSRTYVPGAYSNSAFTSVGGVEQRVRHSRGPLAGDRLSLSYSCLTEEEVGQVLSHYASTLGGFRTFGLRPETLVNLGVVARHLNRARSRGEYAPRGAGWAYASEPVVRNRLRDVNELTVELELLAEPFPLEVPADAGELVIASDVGLRLTAAVMDATVAGEASIVVGGALVPSRVFAGDASVTVTSDIAFNEGDQQIPEEGIAAGTLTIEVAGGLQLDRPLSGAAGAIAIDSDGALNLGRRLDGLSGLILIESNGELMRDSMLVAAGAELQVSGLGDLEL